MSGNLGKGGDQTLEELAREGKDSVEGKGGRKKKRGSGPSHPEISGHSGRDGFTSHMMTHKAKRGGV